MEPSASGRTYREHSINMRIVDDQAIRRHAAVRFRSEYDYAVFEYWRSAKVLAYLESAGVTQVRSRAGRWLRRRRDVCVVRRRGAIGDWHRARRSFSRRRDAAGGGKGRDECQLRSCRRHGAAIQERLFRSGALTFRHRTRRRSTRLFEGSETCARAKRRDAVEHGAVSLVAGIASAEVQAAVSAAVATDRRAKSRVRRCVLGRQTQAALVRRRFAELVIRDRAGRRRNKVDDLLYRATVRNLREKHS